jgi:mono/diheme cytochrome c family protein/uncharacterized membrane protein
MPEIPDFANTGWQKTCSNSRLRVSILEGKGTGMPPFNDRLSREDLDEVMAIVRSFGPATTERGAARVDEFEAQFQELQTKLEELRRQFREIRGHEPGLSNPRSAISETGPEEINEASEELSGTEGEQRLISFLGDSNGRGGESTSDGRAAQQHFRRACAKCHDADGTGRQSRERMADIPDFTDSRWQAQRNDAQLLRSILEGKGEDMPPFRGKLTEEQARALVTEVRAFSRQREKEPGIANQESEIRDRGSKSRDQVSSNRDRELRTVNGGKQAQKPAEGRATEASGRTRRELSAGNEDLRRSEGFFEKLIPWLGKFHPPIVSFPIALLVAAATAEALRIVTGNPIFASHSRYCVWLAAITAAFAGLLGWFLAGSRMADTSWVMTLHRWLGTTTVTWALLVLALSEVSRRPDRRATQQAFRLTLFLGAGLVLSTGFLGGALVYGLDHYAWPR